MRVFVAIETSGSSRSAFDTVMTETLARSAMSLSRTMVSRGYNVEALESGAAPMKLDAQGFKKGAAFKLHQPDIAPAAADRDLIAGGQFGNDLAVGAQDGRGARIHDADRDR